MRISELERRSGVPSATIKYYLREGLLPPGELTSTTQAQYDDDHVTRLRLVRALVGPAGLSIARTREVLRIIDRPTDDLFSALGEVQHVINDEQEETDDAAAHALIDRAGWLIDPASPEIGALAAALRALDDAGFEVPDGVMKTYIAATGSIASAELAHMSPHRPDALRYVVLGTILAGPLIAVMRRLAEQDAALRRLAPPDDA